MNHYKKILSSLLICYCLILSGCASDQSLRYITMPFAERVKLAKKGDATAQFNLGMLYLFGGWPQKIEQDPELAFQWFRLSAQNHNLQAMGILCSVSDGEPWAKYLLEAADNGDIQAIELLLNANDNCLMGIIIETENYAQQRDAMKEKWGQQRLTYYERETNKGNADAQTQLGLLYKSGNGVTSDSTKATALWQQAAKQQQPFAMMAYAKILRQTDEGRDKAQQYEQQALQLLQNKVKQGIASADDLVLLAALYTKNSSMTGNDKDKLKIGQLLLLSIIATTEISNDDSELFGFSWGVMAFQHYFAGLTPNEIDALYQLVKQCQTHISDKCY